MPYREVDYKAKVDKHVYVMEQNNQHNLAVDLFRIVRS